MNRLASMLAVAATCLLVPLAHAQDFGEWDVDDNGSLSRAEFEPGIGTTGWFRQWDADRNAMLAEAELASGVFRLFDRNDDGVLDRQEWERGIAAFYGPGTPDFAVSDWDADADDVLDEDEFAAGLASTGLYRGLAGYDRALTEPEFARGLFDWWENDDDDMLSRDEWEPPSRLLE